MRVGVDTGGTFTDVVADDGAVAQAAVHARRSGARGARRGATSSCAPVVRLAVLAHGTTVATNALLERRLGRVALVTTRGFADVIEIARQDRPSLYDPYVDRPDAARAALVAVRGRRAARRRRSRARAVRRRAFPTIGAVDAVAVCLLHADLDPGHERAVADVLRARGHDVSCSHEVSPEFREYERHRHHGRRTPCLRPRVPRRTSRGLGAGRRRGAGHDLGRRAGAASTAAAELPVALLLSGPAGGVRAAAAVAAARAASPTRSRSTWAAPAPTCAWCGTACPSRRRDARGRRATRAAARARRSTPSAPAAARSPRLDAGGALVVGPAERRRRSRARPATAAAAPRRRSPTPTSCSAASRPTPRSPGSGGSTSTPPRAALDACRRDGRGRGRGRRRGDGAGACGW